MSDGRGRRGIASRPIACESQLSKHGKAAYIGLTTFADGDRETYVGLARLAATMGVSEDSIQRGMAELRAAGYLEVELRSGRTSLYTLVDDVSAKQAAEDPETVQGIYGFVYAGPLETARSAAAKATYSCLAIHANRLRVASPSVAQIARESGYSKATVKRGLRELRDLGIVETTERHRGDPDFPEDGFHYASNLSQLREEVGSHSGRLGSGSGGWGVTQRPPGVRERSVGVRERPPGVTQRSEQDQDQDQDQDHGQDQENQDHEARPAPLRVADEVSEPERDPMASERVVSVNFGRGGAAAREAQERLDEQERQEDLDEIAAPILARIAELQDRGIDLRAGLGSEIYSEAWQLGLIPPKRSA
ncbi:helix-turn-helix domain-containing protein [Amycolatopsis vastitatis]|uniref:Helix-turn-helix domain-containing protein n=1 Tax=Amycolatopsis vastitatis TaxID=1905142 RepID=A0A229T8Z0_9PSEU|nr:helix-turn-helix domain-containing protein [Amycolatopsis vastitatis]OXM67219.1 hypothetical protein CF165_17405 [Amycolatopsis vastitatis]